MVMRCATELNVRHVAFASSKLKEISTELKCSYNNKKLHAHTLLCPDRYFPGTEGAEGPSKSCVNLVLPSQNWVTSYNITTEIIIMFLCNVSSDHQKK